jgi:hypothetical protein
MAATRKRINEDRVITVHGKAEDGSNPKRPGSHAAIRFDKYVSGMTIREAKAAGLKATDIAYDERHGFITLSPDPEPVEGEAVTEKAPKKRARRKKVEAAPAADAEAAAA